MKERLKKARKELGYSQLEFAQKLGLTQQAYGMIERGVTSLSDKHIKPICAIFGISEKWLREGEGEMMDNIAIVSEITNIARELSLPNQEDLMYFANRMLERQNEEADEEYTDPTPTTGEGE